MLSGGGSSAFDVLVVRVVIPDPMMNAGVGLLLLKTQ
jgi:hypothetical protein